MSFRSTCPSVLAVIFVLCATQPGKAQTNWPQWRGPLATGVAPAASPPVEWSKDKNLKWKVKIPGHGTATPIIWENRVFIQTAIPTGKKVDLPDKDARPGAEAKPQADAATKPNDVEKDKKGDKKSSRGGGGRRGMSVAPTQSHQFVLLCLDRQSGKELWQKVAREELPHEGHHRDHGFSSHSPITDGEHVFAYFGSRGLHCYDLEGNAKWSKDLGRMQTKNGFGEGSSPALHGDTIVVNWDHEGEDFIVAFNKRTGKELWRQPRDEDTSWATPLVVEHDGKPQVITAATNRIRSYDLLTGKTVWECEGLTPNTIPSPVSADGMVYLTSGYRGNKLYAIRLGATGDVTDTEAIVWRHEKSTPYVPSPLLHDNRLYFFASNNGILSAFDVKTGKSLFGPDRIEGLQGVYSSPVAAAGKVYLVGRNGTAVVIKSGDQLEILATNRLDERMDASPAVAGRELFLRGHEHLYCIAE